jgi:ferredoxin
MACLRHVSEANILAAFGRGAAGVALLGCDTCPHGERQLVVEKLELATIILDAFGLGAERVHLITGGPEEILGAVDQLAQAAVPSPVRWGDWEGGSSGLNRETITDAIKALIAATGREPGRVPLPPTAPFAFPDVRVSGCTLCRTCVNVCPTHAFRYLERTQTLELKQVACVNCGLCATACPEAVITLKPELYLDRTALEYTVVVQDETLKCTKCGVPFGNKRAVEVIEAKVFGMEKFLDTFAGERRSLLRMCPNCRAAAAAFEMQKGWDP